MSNFALAMRQALTIARRDFSAIVMTPLFLLFLLSPLLMLAFGFAGGMAAETATTSAASRERVAILVPPAMIETIRNTDADLRKITARDTKPSTLEIQVAGEDPEGQAQALIATSSGQNIVAILYGSLAQPTILHRPSAASDGLYLASLAEYTLRAERSGSIGQHLSTPTITIVGAGETTETGSSLAGYLAVTGLFFLTLFLSSQAVAALAEERTNKIIEVLAAAAPLESVFFGKLLGAFACALIFVGFWGTLFLTLPRFAPEELLVALRELSPQTGAAFPFLFCAYFTTSYLLQSALFLGFGSQASTMREIQLLSLPITILQFALFGLASYASGNPDSWIARFAEIFPLSSPLGMVARAANSPEIWPHLLALIWQIFWLAVTITLSARLFRRGVLKSGSAPFWKRKSPTIDTAVN